MVLVLGRRLPQDKNQFGESDFFLFVSRFIKKKNVSPLV